MDTLAKQTDKLVLITTSQCPDRRDFRLGHTQQLQRSLQPTSSFVGPSEQHIGHYVQQAAELDGPLD